MEGREVAVVITLTVNGKSRTLPGETSVTSFLAEYGIDPRIVAVEHNGIVLDREQFAETVLRDGDQVEVVRMIGGG